MSEGEGAPGTDTSATLECNQLETRLISGLCLSNSIMQALYRRSSVQQARPGVRARVSRRQQLLVQAKKTADGPSIAVVGVTGAVGQEFLQVSQADVAARNTHEHINA